MGVGGVEGRLQNTCTGLKCDWCLMTEVRQMNVSGLNILIPLVPCLLISAFINSAQYFISAQ